MLTPASVRAVRRVSADEDRDLQIGKPPRNADYLVTEGLDAIEKASGSQALAPGPNAVPLDLRRRFRSNMVICCAPAVRLMAVDISASVAFTLVAISATSPISIDSVDYHLCSTGSVRS
jgi:hypothetical protein